MIDEKLSQLLRLIVERHVKTAEPVSSKELCEVFSLPVSSATVRNLMAELESRGYITQPHTSSGRIPTELGYRYYINHLSSVKSRRLPGLQITITIQTPEQRQPSLEDRLKGIALKLAELSGEAVMVATSKPWGITVGTGNLLRKPEFRSEEAILGLAASLEKFDQAARDLMNVADSEVKVILGLDNPFGSHLASVMVRHQLPKGEQGAISIIGPMRMDYQKNILLLTKAKEIIEQKELPNYDQSN